MKDRMIDGRQGEGGKEEARKNERGKSRRLAEQRDAEGMAIYVGFRRLYRYFQKKKKSMNLSSLWMYHGVVMSS